jgi:hypothetical protein
VIPRGIRHQRGLASKALRPADQVQLVLKLVPLAVTNRTALDTVLSRLILAHRSGDAAVLADIEDALTAYPVAETLDTAGPEPMAQE